MPKFDQELKKAYIDHPREFSNFVYCYPVLSRRAGGVSIGVNLNLDKACNFDCPYCQVDRTISKAKQPISVSAVRSELGQLLKSFEADGTCNLKQFKDIPKPNKRLKDIAISGDGEPTMIPEFSEICEMVALIQQSRPDLEFKLVLITNSTLLDRPNVLDGIGSLLSTKGEIWAKLDAGTEEWFQKINISRVSLDKIETNLISLGQLHPYKIQSLFCALDGVEPSALELDEYLRRLKKIKASGSRITEVQLHTLARKPSQVSCTPLSTDFLFQLRNRILTELEIPAVVYGTEG